MSAALQNQSSSLTMIKAADKLGEGPSNKQAFLCRHNVQVPRIIREFKPFAVVLLTEFDICRRQSLKEGSSG
jgi:hypothetical protein